MGTAVSAPEKTVSSPMDRTRLNPKACELYGSMVKSLKGVLVLPSSMPHRASRRWPLEDALYRVEQDDVVPTFRAHN